MAKRKKYILFGMFLVSILFQLSVSLIQGQMSRIIILWPNPDNQARPVLQLLSIPFITLPPAPSITFTPTLTPKISQSPSTGPYCPPESIKPEGSNCKCPFEEEEFAACPAENNSPLKCPGDTEPIEENGKWYCWQPNELGKSSPTPAPGCRILCIGKPVVYLYPTKPTSVSVTVEAPGAVIASDPLYPDGGWKNVLAYPDGTLFYKGKKYSELFYETLITKKIDMPEEGIIIPSEELESTLRSATARLGLIPKEQDEFLEYWVPVLRNLQSPYILFSVLPPEIKDSVDRLIITPEPDTRIEIIAYFKPLDKPINISPLHLPQMPPKRVGFTEVEWGGTIGY